MYLYSALFVVPHTQGAQVRITQCYLQITPYLPLPRKHSPDGTSPDWCCRHLIAAYCSFIYPERMKGWVGECIEYTFSIPLTYKVHTTTQPSYLQNFISSTPSQYRLLRAGLRSWGGGGAVPNVKRAGPCPIRHSQVSTPHYPSRPPLWSGKLWPGHFSSNFYMLNNDL